MHRQIRNVLRFIIKHRKLDKLFEKWNWYKHLCYEEAQAILGNRPWD